MKQFTFIHAALGALLCSTLTACPDNSGDPTGADTSASATMVTTGTTDDTTTNNPTTTNPTTTDDTTTNNPTTDDTTTTDPTGGDGGFTFLEDPPEAYKQIDRHGAVEAGTAGIRAAAGLGFGGEDLSIRDMYNASNPEQDAAGMWLPEIGMSITFFHDALDDDLMALMLVPATVQETVDQAGPVIVPDTIKYDPKMPTAYPNGRKLTDQVVDITLAAVLLKLGPNQPLSLLADLPLNPPENDVPFSAAFPYLAPPHAP